MLYLSLLGTKELSWGWSGTAVTAVCCPALEWQERGEESLITALWERGREREGATAFRNASCDKAASAGTRTHRRTRRQTHTREAAPRRNAACDCKRDHSPAPPTHTELFQLSPNVLVGVPRCGREGEHPPPAPSLRRAAAGRAAGARPVPRPAAGARRWCSFTTRTQNLNAEQRKPDWYSSTAGFVLIFCLFFSFFNEGDPSKTFFARSQRGIPSPPLPKALLSL